MKPGHYCTHAIDDMKELIDSFFYSFKDAERVHSAMHFLNQSVKFILPESGILYETISSKSPDLERDIMFKDDLRGAGIDESFQSIKVNDHELESWGLPYPVCAFEYSNNQESVILLVISGEASEDGSVAIIPIIRADQNSCFSMFTVGLQIYDVRDTASFQGIIRAERRYLEDRHKEIFDGKPPGHILSQTMNMSLFFYSIVQACTFLRCNNVYIKDIPAPKLLNRKRKKKRKTPFYEYKVLEVKQSSQVVLVSEPTGRTHKSPRIHLRRGHIRTFKNGTSTYVRPCVVGSKKHGIVYKDYSVAKH